MKFTKIAVTDFSLEYTYASGQTLNFVGSLERKGKAYLLEFSTTRSFYTVKYENGNVLYWSAVGRSGKKEQEKELLESLGLNGDIQEVYRNIEKNALMEKAIKEFYGMRLVKFDPWETSVCFIISQFNNIKRIKGIVSRLIDKFGESYKGAKFFPSPLALSKAGIEGLASCGLGFRAKYLFEFSKSVNSGALDFSSVCAGDYARAKSELLKFKGIGLHSPFRLRQGRSLSCRRLDKQDNEAIHE